MHSSHDTFSIARELIRKKEFAEAEALLLETIEAEPMNAIFWGLLAETYFNAGKIDKAQEANNKALSINPFDYFALQRKGDIFASMKHYDEALGIFESLLTSPKASHYLYKRIAKIHYLRKDPQKALETLRKAIEIFPGKADLYYQAYALYKEGGLRDDAMHAIAEAAHLEPENELYRSAKLSLRAEGESAENLEEAVELAGHSDPGMLRILGRKLKKEGQPEKAIEIFKKVVALDNSDFSRKELAFAYYHNKDFQKAFALFMSLDDEAFSDAPFVASIVAAAKTREEKEALLERMARLAVGGNKALWGKVSKLKKELAQIAEHEND